MALTTLPPSYTTPTPSPARRRFTLLVTLLVVLATLGAVAAVKLWPNQASATVEGIADGDVLGQSTLAGAALRILPGEDVTPEQVQVSVDAVPVQTTPEGGYLVWRPTGLADGPHEVVVDVRGSGTFARDSTTRIGFEIDATPPSLTMPPLVEAGAFDSALTVSGSVQGADSVVIEGADVALAPDGTFTATFATPPASVVATTTDAAGNVATASTAVAVTHPGMRAVHMTASAWTSDSLREPILEMLRSGKIDTIQLDIKDEDGIVGYSSSVALAQQIGASSGTYDAAEALRTIHDMGGRVVGRLVAFRDPKLGKWSWENGFRDRVVQTPAGEPYGKDTYGPYSFTNPANAEVQQYNIDLAVEAANLGFDDILYDYIRRPDGKLEKLVFPTFQGDPAPLIVDFLRRTKEVVRPAGAYVGVSVYGIAATRGNQIAQNIPEMAKYADYISPMVYPSHWGEGEYDLDDPNGQPYEIVQRSLVDFQTIVNGTNVKIIPWLQDFSMGRQYGAPEVRAQIDGAAANGIPSFLLWNASSKYHADAL